MITVKELKRCCTLSVYTYRAKPIQNTRMIHLDGLQNMHKRHDAQAILSKTNDATYVAFRGSSSAADFKDVFNVKPCKTDYGIVHSGFLDQYKSLMDMLHQHLLAERPSRIYFTGHSLGGSVAMISALMMHNELNAQTHCITYGAPTTADEEFLENVGRVCTSFTCVETKNDVVPHIVLHPSLKKNSETPFVRVLSPVDDIPVWDIWNNHSCMTYQRSLASDLRLKS